MKRYTYPAVMTPEDDGGFSVYFPDLEGCYTCGDDLSDAIYMAQDVLAYTLFDYERGRKDIPSPSKLSSINLKKGEFVNFIACDTLEYQKKHNNKAVKKTLSIPEWMNEQAVSAGINFSQLLQEAIIDRLHLA